MVLCVPLFRSGLCNACMDYLVDLDSVFSSPVLGSAQGSFLLKQSLSLPPLHILRALGPVKCLDTIFYF